MSDRVELMACGGGRQSAGITALILEGRLPRPDHVAMTALEWERKATYRYVCNYIRPAFRSLSIPFTFVPRKKYATKDFLGGSDGASVLVPAFTDYSGQRSKLPEWCSGEWKREVSLRWAAEQPDWKQRGVNLWVGISLDEARRRRAPRRQWYQPTYPLLDVLPLGVAGCLAAVARQGWPEPPRSRCFHCPNQSDAEWLELTPEEFELACRRDEWLRETDPHVYLHRQLIPLRQVRLNREDSLFGGGCSAGTCY
jgi:hypothetical protein